MKRGNKFHENTSSRKLNLDTTHSRDFSRELRMVTYGKSYLW